MIIKRFVSAEGFEVSRAKAYRLIRQMNEELEAMGCIKAAGRISRKYYYERTYGMFEVERGEADAGV